MAFDFGRETVTEETHAPEEAPVPGKRTLTEGLAVQMSPVQRRETPGPESYADIHAAAARGIEGPATSLPHADAIQRSFGDAADVSGIQAHVGGPAAEGARAMGATAFAAGNHVAFEGAPDLHTAAHEAAHVVQQSRGVQLYGGVGAAGDVYEQHADAVADRVVAGESAADLFTHGPIANAPAGGWGGVQRKIAAPIVQRKGEAAPAPGTHPPLTTPDGQPAPPVPTAAPEKVAKLHLFVDIEAPSIGIKELKEGAVGHTWIAIEYTDPAKVPDTVHSAHKALLKTGGKYSDPMGFWPDIQNGVGYSTNPFDSYVDGWMRHPDTAHQGAEKGMQTWELTQTEVDAVIAYAESKRGAKYSVYFFNCTTFGVEAVAAAGKNAPSGGHAVMYPNALYDSIKERNKKKQGDTMVKDFDGSNESVVHGADAKKG